VAVHDPRITPHTTAKRTANKILIAGRLDAPELIADAKGIAKNVLIPKVYPV
jgi:hypothetical protein